MPNIDYFENALTQISKATYSLEDTVKSLRRAKEYLNSQERLMRRFTKDVGDVTELNLDTIRIIKDLTKISIRLNDLYLSVIDSQGNHQDRI